MPLLAEKSWHRPGWQGGIRMTELEKLIKKMPPEIRAEVTAYAKALMKKTKKTRGKPEFKWAGALKDLKDQYTSVELQHYISRLRAGEK